MGNHASKKIQQAKTFTKECRQAALANEQNGHVNNLLRTRVTPATAKDKSPKPIATGAWEEPSGKKKKKKNKNSSDFDSFEVREEEKSSFSNSDFDLVP